MIINVTEAYNDYANSQLSITEYFEDMHNCVNEAIYGLGYNMGLLKCGFIQESGIILAEADQVKIKKSVFSYVKSFIEMIKGKIIQAYDFLKRKFDEIKKNFKDKRDQAKIDRWHKKVEKAKEKAAKEFDEVIDDFEVEYENINTGETITEDELDKLREEKMKFAQNIYNLHKTATEQMAKSMEEIYKNNTTDDLESKYEKCFEDIDKALDDLL